MRAMEGRLFVYSKQNLQAFASGPTAKVLVMIGGLSDGLLACPYVPSLAAGLETIEWGIVQPVLRSSYCQFGFRTLDDDVEDLDALLAHLESTDNTQQFALCGHSTGAQIASHFYRRTSHRKVTHLVLQAGVSDRETDDEADRDRQAKYLGVARDMPGDEMLPRDAMWAPITARRFLDLYEVNGTDDYFSSDLDDHTLRAKFANFGDLEGVLVAFSGSDEYCPPSVDKDRLVRRLCDAMVPSPTKRRVPLVIPGADHALSSTEAQASFVQAVLTLLTSTSFADGSSPATAT